MSSNDEVISFWGGQLSFYPDGKLQSVMGHLSNLELPVALTYQSNSVEIKRELNAGDDQFLAGFDSKGRLVHYHIGPIDLCKGRTSIQTEHGKVRGNATNELIFRNGRLISETLPCQSL